MGCGKGRLCFGHEKEERLREETTREFELTALNCKGKSLRLTNKKPHIGHLSTTDAEQEADDLDLNVVKEVLRKPIGPAIGFVSQFIFMPLCSFALGFVFDNPEMRLGLFFTGTSPGGGASNIWTIMFGGNLNLSVTMTAVSTFSAFFMMPLWIFTLGATIFHENDIIIPYYKICIYAFFLVIPLSIGLALQR